MYHRIDGCRYESSRSGPRRAGGRGRQAALRSDPRAGAGPAALRGRSGVPVRAAAVVRGLPADDVAPPQEARRGGRRRGRAARPVGLLLHRSPSTGGPEVMAVLRPHLALTVTDVERAIPFYEAL